MAIVARYYTSDLAGVYTDNASATGMNRNGYGSRIRTGRLVRLPGEKRWRRVYACCWGIPTEYVRLNKGKDWAVILYP